MTAMASKFKTVIGMIDLWILRIRTSTPYHDLVDFLRDAFFVLWFGAAMILMFFMPMATTVMVVLGVKMLNKR